MSGKGSATRPYSVPKETFDQSFERIFGITCKRCGKRGLKADSVHTCTSKEVREQINDKKLNTNLETGGHQLPDGACSVYGKSY